MKSPSAQGVFLVIALGLFACSDVQLWTGPPRITDNPNPTRFSPLETMLGMADPPTVPTASPQPTPTPTPIAGNNVGGSLNAADPLVQIAAVNGKSLEITPNRIILVDLQQTGQFKALLREGQDPNREPLAADVVWSSADPAVVQIDQTGKITSLTTGSLLITATLKSNPALKATASVLVIIGSSGSGNSADGGALSAPAATPIPTPTPTPTLNPNQVIGQIGNG